MTDEILELTADLPVVDLDTGQVLVAEGDRALTASIWILMSGALRVLKNGVPVNTITRPGAVIGEMSVLLDAASAATVEALEPTRLRHATDGHALLADHPDIVRQVAVGLAERLNFVTSYLADLKVQYGDAPGLSMVSDVLAELAVRQAPPARPGSARDPDPNY